MNLEKKIKTTKPTIWVTDGIPKWKVWLIVRFAKFKTRLRRKYIMAISTVKTKNCKLKDLQLHKPTEEGGPWFLSAVYQTEDDRGIYEIDIPRIHLPISGGLMINTDYSYYKPFNDARHTINIGFGEQILLQDEHGHLFYEKLIEEKIHDLTLDEIEKKLGFKVRVVNKKSEG